MVSSEGLLHVLHFVVKEKRSNCDCLWLIKDIWWVNICTEKILTIMLFTSFCYSAVLAWQLAKQIEHKEKDKKRKAKREANMAKARRHKSD